MAAASSSNEGAPEPAQAYEAAFICGRCGFKNIQLGSSANADTGVAAAFLCNKCDAHITVVSTGAQDGGHLMTSIMDTSEMKDAATREQRHAQLVAEE